MKQLIFSILITFSLIKPFSASAQEILHPDEIGDHFSYFRETFNQKIDYINEIVWMGDELLGNTDVSEDSLQALRQERVEYLMDILNDDKNQWLELENKIADSKKTLEEYTPFMPQAGYALLDIYRKSAPLVERVKAEYDVLFKNTEKEIRAKYGSVKMDSIGYDLQDKKLLTEIRNLAERDLYENDLLQAAYRMNDKALCERELKFLKKNKIRFLKGHLNPDGPSDFTVRNAKTGKVGFISFDSRFESKKVTWYFPAIYDSIIIDHSRIENMNFWTTAIAWSGNSTLVLEKEIISPEFFNSESGMVRYESKYKDISFSDGSKAANGVVALLNENGTFSLVDIQKDSILSPQYAKRVYVPRVLFGRVDYESKTILNTGEIRFDNYYYEDDVIAFELSYDDASKSVRRVKTRNTEAWYNEDRSLSSISTKYGDTLSTSEHYYPSGIKQSFYSTRHYYENGELKRNKSVADSTFHENGALESIGYRIAKDKGGSFERYYSNGQLHARGAYRDTTAQGRTEYHLDGPYESYYYDGQLKSKGTYKIGLTHGKMEFYDPFGKEIKFDQNSNERTRLVFPATYYDENGETEVLENRFGGLSLVNGLVTGKEHTMHWLDEMYSYQQDLCEIWDMHTGRQLEAAYKVPLDPKGFLSKYIVYGIKMDFGGLPGYYDLLNKREIQRGKGNITPWFTRNLNTALPLNEKQGLVLVDADERVNDMIKTDLLLYDFDSLTVIDTIRSYSGGHFNISNDGKHLHVVKDSVYYRINTSDFRISKKYTIRYPDNYKFYEYGFTIQNDCFITYDTRYYGRDSIGIANVRVKNLYDPAEVLIMKDSIYLVSRYVPESISESSYPLIFIDKANPDSCYHLQYDFKNKTIDFKKDLLANQVYHPVSKSPKRKLYIDVVEKNNDTLSLSSIDNASFEVELKTGRVKPIAQLPEMKSEKDSFNLVSHEHQEIQYLLSLQFKEKLDFDKKSKIHVLHPESDDSLKYIYVVGESDRRCLFQNKNKTNSDQFVFFDINENGEYLFSTPDQYYMGSKKLNELVFFKKGNEYFDFEQFDLKFNRPDIILERMGYADSSLVSAYHQAYLKRLKKMGFTEEMLEDDFHLPEIKIENFEYMPKYIDLGSIQLKLKLNDSKYPLDRINIWVNDVAVYGTDGISIRDKKVKQYSTAVDVLLAKGKNKIQVSVLNQAGAESYKETIEIECSAGKPKPDLYLISIGESEFLQSDFNLTYAAKDAKDIVSLFEKSTVFEKVHSKTLVNEQVTKENIMALSTFLKKADINDEVMIFIAGHGVLDAKLDYYFATHDMDFQHPEKKGLAYESFESLLDGIKPLKKILLIDACHSGEIDKEEVELAHTVVKSERNIKFRNVGHTAAPKLGMQNTSELTRSLFTDLRKGTGATVISSAGGMEFAMEGDNWNNGLFTYCLINGIQSNAADLNGDKEIWLSEIQQYVAQQVAQLSGGKQQPTSRIENQTVDFRVW